MSFHKKYFQGNVFIVKKKHHSVDSFFFFKKYPHNFFFLKKRQTVYHGINYHTSIYIRIDICQGEPTSYMTKTNRHTDSFYANGANSFFLLFFHLRRNFCIYILNERGREE